MKYVIGALAVVAAVAALFFRPPPFAAPVPATGGTAGIGRPMPPPLEFATVAQSPAPARLIVVYVAGEVRTPGVYTLASSARAQDALARAGGPRPDADLVAVNLAAPVHDGDEIAVPKIGVEVSRRGRANAPRPHASHRPHGRRHRAKTAIAATAAAPTPVDLNTAAAEDLEAIPGVGPALAARIVAYRATNGPFNSIDELADVSGITPGLQDRLAAFVVIR